MSNYGNDGKHKGEPDRDSDGELVIYKKYGNDNVKLIRNGYLYDFSSDDEGDVYAIIVDEEGDVHVKMINDMKFIMEEEND